MEVYRGALPVEEEEALEECGDGADGVVAGADKGQVNYLVLNRETPVIKGSLNHSLEIYLGCIDIVGTLATFRSEILSKSLHFGLCYAEAIREVGLAA